MDTATSKEVLRARRDTTGAVVLDRVAVCDACSGPNHPMISDAEATYARLGERLAMAASSRLFAPQRVSGVNAVPPGGSSCSTFHRTGATKRAAPGPRPANATMAYNHRVLLSQPPSSLPPIPPSKGGAQNNQNAVGPSSAFPRATAGAVLSTSCANAYYQKLDGAKLLQELRQDADCAREMQSMEYERKLREQGVMWERRTAQLEDEVRQLRHLLAAVDGAVAQGAVVQSPPMLPEGPRRQCGGPAPSGGVMRRPARGHRNPLFANGSGDADTDLSPQRITEALIHVLEKQPMHVLLRKRNR